ncbi:hypothetical protein [Bradyrhizobium viridifuturi]|uniref:hypothetical protein n=1 Tax=Bradyrhizobium viridifuturi TaxID=1654716 RepID=UPI00067EBB67|nr:hypothetical protein [Bradyrhizobium viridifuturi]
MPAYLVRVAKTRDLVGFFYAEDDEHLELIVDECTDVPDCEYMELPHGGIMWESPAIDVPIEVNREYDPEDDEEVPSLPWSGAALTEAWFSVVYGYTDEEWIRFVPEEPLNPQPPTPRRSTTQGRRARRRR